MHPTVSPTYAPPVVSPWGRIALPGAIVFLANAALLVLQLVAGRLLAPFLGSSLETWTTIIGCFLIGIAVGNSLGGRLADRFRSPRLPALVLLLGGAATAGMVLFCAMLHQHPPWYQSYSLSIRIPLLSFALCFLPATILSLLTPITIRLALPDLDHIGRVAGLIYALSTLGCLIGNYLTGFVLLAAFELDTIVLAIAGFLGVLAVAQYVVARNVRVVNPPTELESSTGTTTTEPAEENPFRGRLWASFLVVFTASFCGMTLELVGIRFLAPILGVSLYTITGVIGVMLAGTAVGNHLGGLLADRGPAVAMRVFAYVFFLLFGIFSAYSLLRTIDPRLPTRLENQLGSLTPLVIHTCGGVVGLSAVFWGSRLARIRYGEFLVLGLSGVLIGAWAGPHLFRSYENNTLVKTITDWHQQLSADTGRNWSEPLERSFGAFLGILVAVIFGGMAISGRDRSQRTRLQTLESCFFLAALTTLFVLISTALLDCSQSVRELNIIERVIVVTFALFFLPMLFLGTVSPQVIRLSTSGLRHAGKTAGSIYAISTLGAIVGTFATGYVLISELGMYRVLMIVSLILAALALLVGRAWNNNAMLYGISIVFGGVITGLFLVGFGSQNYTLETNYYAIRVSEEKIKLGDDQERTVRKMALDNLLHSVVDPNDPTYLFYEHEQIQVEFTSWFRALRPADQPIRILVIGGGGYTFPRCVSVLQPSALVDVVEIDPGVTEVAVRNLGLELNERLRAIHMDGRRFVCEVAPKQGFQYDLIIQDAVNDLSVPYHLLTKEYNQAIERILAPDGVYLLTVIDLLGDGKLWRAGVTTLQETFSRPNVALLAPTGTWPREKREVLVLYAARSPFDRTEFRKHVESQQNGRLRTNRLGKPGPGLWTHQLEPAKLQEFLAEKPRLILTDQFAPVDNLMSDVFRLRTE